MSLHVRSCAFSTAVPAFAYCILRIVCCILAAALYLHIFVVACHILVTLLPKNGKFVVQCSMRDEVSHAPRNAGILEITLRVLENELGWG